MTATQISDAVMSDRFQHDEMEAAVLRILDLVDTVAGTETAALEETPDARRQEAAGIFLEYFAKRYYASTARREAADHA